MKAIILFLQSGLIFPFGGGLINPSNTDWDKACIIHNNRQLEVKKALISEGFHVIPERLERSTHSLEGCCSIQLSYGTFFRVQKYIFFQFLQPECENEMNLLPNCNINQIVFI